MNAQIIKLGEGYYFLKIKDLMTSNQMSEIWEEINFLSFRSKLQQDTSTARDLEGNLKSNKLGVWLDNIYSERKFSNYFKYYKKWLTDETKTNLYKTTLSWRELDSCGLDNTLLSYYENKVFYSEHIDDSRFTQLFWTFKQPKKFEGGELIFTDFNYQIDIEDNLMILFPSWFFHKVKTVYLNEKTSEDQDKLTRNGRYVFTTFYR